MNSKLPKLAKIAGHLIILGGCILFSLALVGRFTWTDSTINGVSIDKLSSATVVEGYKSRNVVTTTHIAVLGQRVSITGLVFSALLWPITAVLLLLLVYGPGFFWSSASRAGVRFAIALALFASIVLGASG